MHHDDLNTWPAELPQSFDAGQRLIEPQDMRLQSQTDSGITKTRLRHSRRITVRSGKMTLNDQQRTVLEMFFWQGTAHGTWPFLWPVCEGGELNQVAVIFREIPRYSSIGGGHWVATFALEEGGI